MGILNLSHGALYMIGAYVGWSIAVQQGLNFWLAVVAGGGIAGCLGLIMERGFFRRLHGMINEQVLLTFGFIYILTNLALWIWGGVPKASFTSPSLAGSIEIIGDWTYSKARLVITGIGIFLAAALWWLQTKTRIGAIIRAGMDNKEMIMGLGINYEAVATAVFFLGCFLAGGAGVIGAYLFGVTLELGMSILLLAVVVVVVGGTGSVQGALVGGILIGLIISFGKALFPQISMFLVYLTMIIILLIKPSGIMGKKTDKR
jgi:branched-chain amino acid transport system permease protein